MSDDLTTGLRSAMLHNVRRRCLVHDPGWCNERAWNPIERDMRDLRSSWKYSRGTDLELSLDEDPSLPSRLHERGPNSHEN